ncbi:tyrosine-type recombinase/integrase [Gemmatimonadota bacterium]
MGSTKKGWSYSAGERGRNRVRAFEDAKTGILTLEYYESYLGRPSQRRRVSVGHRDYNRAKRQVDEAAARLGQEKVPSASHLTLQQLFENYVRERTPQKSLQVQDQDRRLAKLFLQCFGPSRKPGELSRREWDLYIRDRRSGQLKPKGCLKDGVGPRTVEKELRWLHAVFNWATRVSVGRGEYLVDRNPLKGLPFPKEKNPARPTITEEQYQSLVTASKDLDWRFQVALVLAHETGHRIGAIRRLHWADVHLGEGIIRWVAENEKTGFEHRTPVTEAASQALERARAQNPGIGEAWVLPAPGCPSEPCSRHLMRDWWQRAERSAGFEHVRGLGWHSLRRKFATDLQEKPLKVLCQLGGWKSFKTVLECYQQPDEASMRKALGERQTTRAAAGG